MDDMKRKHDEHEEMEYTEEATPEDVEIEALDEREHGKLKQLKEKLNVCEEEKRKHLEDLQRTKADFLNSKRRLEAQQQSDRKRIAERHVEELLPLADSFEMSLQNTDAWKEADSAWQKGIEQIHAQLKSILTRYQVERFGTVGDAFDPALHEAVLNEPVSEESKHQTITAVLQSGYTMEGNVIRPARVAVGEYTE